MNSTDNSLDTMGFYTMTDERCKNARADSCLSRCVLVVTEKCNFSCPYCRSHTGNHISTDEAVKTMELWASQGLYAILLTGGEPTLHPHIEKLVQTAKTLGIERVSIGTNGSANIDLYRRLFESGVDDFAISLDADNAVDAAVMSGAKNMAWNKLVSNIKTISQWTRVTIGIVINENNYKTAPAILNFALSLGVSDIRLNPAAQYSARLPESLMVDKSWAERYPILQWRIKNAAKGYGVRGLQRSDPNRCFLALDEMTVSNGFHYPCFIYMREGGEPIGKLDANFRQQRADWVKKHDTHRDVICLANCPDCLSMYNRKFLEYRMTENIEIPT